LRELKAERPEFFKNAKTFDAAESSGRVNKQIEQRLDLEDLAIRSKVDPENPIIQTLQEQIAKDSNFEHLIQRKNIPGYGTTWEDGIEALKDFTDSTAAKYGRALGGRAGDKHLNRLAEGEVKDSAAAFMEIFKNGSNSKADLPMLRQIIGTWYLGGSFSFFAQNLTQPFITTANEIFRHNVNPVQAGKIFSRRMTDAWGLVKQTYKKTPLDLNKIARGDKDLAFGLKQVLADKTISNQFIQELRGGNKFDDFFEFMAIPGTVSEQVNRTHAFLTGWDVGRIKGLEKDALLKFAKDFFRCNSI